MFYGTGTQSSLPYCTTQSHNWLKWNLHLQQHVVVARIPCCSPGVAQSAGGVINICWPWGAMAGPPVSVHQYKWREHDQRHDSLICLCWGCTRRGYLDTTTTKDSSSNSAVLNSTEYFSVFQPTVLGHGPCYKLKADIKYIFHKDVFCHFKSFLSLWCMFRCLLLWSHFMVQKENALIESWAMILTERAGVWAGTLPPNHDGLRGGMGSTECHSSNMCQCQHTRSSAEADNCF